jgi:RNA polymerase sigma-70 factor (ECF subfamily)
MNAMLGGVVTGELRVRGESTSSERARAFEALVEARLDACYRLAAVLLGDRLEAEDATHEAILRAQRSWSTVRDPGAARAWLDRIVVNECRDRLRRRGVARAVANVVAIAPTASSSGGEASAAQREALREALGELSTDHRIVVVLRYLLDLSVDEIAARTSTPAGTVKSRLHHALRALRAAYEALDR